MKTTSRHDDARCLRAGGAIGDITPRASVFLFGYPHVPRWSTGVHDRLECCALYLSDGMSAALFLAHDLIFIPRDLTLAVRREIAAQSEVPEHAIMVTATHTHSGPITAEFLSNAADPVVPKPDGAYLAELRATMVKTALRAIRGAEPAEIGMDVATVRGTGTNRHDPHGPADPEVPVVLARSIASGRALAFMLVHAMHPTVLHENSMLISGDFPHFTRQCLRRTWLGADCPVLFHQGASGNQSPRHVTRGNTFAEAQRLGEILGCAVESVLPRLVFSTDVSLRVRIGKVDLAARRFPTVEEAERSLCRARDRFLGLQRAGAAAPAVRTAECDVFGAEETAELARAASDGRLNAAVAERTPAEIQVVSIGGWNFVAWPGEFFVEYALELRRRASRTHLITVANGELQGYIVTPDAAASGGYEASNAIFAAENGARFIEATLALLSEPQAG